MKPTSSVHDVKNIKFELDRIEQGLRVLRGLPDVEGDRVGLVGHDFGAMYGALIAATDSRPRAMVLAGGTPRWGDWFLPFWSIDEDRFDYLRGLDPVDPIAHVGHVAPTALLFQFGKDDFFIAEMTAREFYQAATEPKELRLYATDHAMESEEARGDRQAFLADQLGFTGRIDPSPG